MDFSITDEGRFIGARMAGPWTMEEICSKAEPILAECLQRKRDLLLIDLMGLANQPVSTIDRYRLGSSMVSFSGKLRRIATAATREFIDTERFGERVARNRGVNVQVFESLETAKKWLLETSRKR